MSECRLCPRACGADRERERGVCRVDGRILVARAAPHYGEEPCISGERGSGAVFFAGCPLGCVYCQNYELSRGALGETLTPEQLAAVFRRLEADGVHNLNLVTGTQFVPGILEALRLAAPAVPAVWNTSGYETIGTIRALAERVRIFLPDLKYALPESAARYSRAADYPAAAMAAVREMVRLTGPFVLGDDGLLRSGVLIRHLVLPGQLDNTRAVIGWVGETFAPGEVLFSLMAQYTPCGDLSRYPELDRTLTPEEWDEALAALEDSGIEDGYVQELSAAGEEEIPAFDGTGVTG
ncbi:MAG: radical SAM protein [Oscillospiraceae bacterium]|nr:radical SAM protein [Oscillospiraceae bacterium]